jgi:chromosome partitioning protein
MVISIASQKGGTGKTSTTISLSAGLARRGKNVLLVDIDSQANSSKVLLHDYTEISKEQTIYATIIDRQPLPVHSTHVAQPLHRPLAHSPLQHRHRADHRQGLPRGAPEERTRQDQGSL